MRLRTYLTALVLAAVVPLFVFAVVIVQQDVAERRTILERGMQDTARALSLAIDGEVKASLAVLETLAASPLLDSSSLESFHELAARAVLGRKGAYIVLFDASGNALLNSSRPFGAALPNPLASSKPADARYPHVPLGGAEPVRKVLETGKPAISDLFISLVTHAPRIALDVPVLRRGRVHQVLELSLDAERFAQVLQEHNSLPSSVLSILDRRGIVIARSLNPAKSVGRPLEAELAGPGPGHTAENMPAHHVITDSSLTGWRISLATWTATVYRSQRQALAALAGGAALALLLGLGAALLIGKRIAEPISLLARTAGPISRGERANVETGGVRELQELHRALAEAGEGARQSTLERERTLIAEESERRFRQIADAAPVLIWMSGTDRQCTWFNKSWLDFVGRAMQQEVGNGWANSVHPEDLDRCLQIYAGAFYALHPFSMQYRMRRADGEYRWVRNDGVPRREPDGSFAGYIGACIDVSDSKHAEAALKEAGRHKDEFLAMLSHELRNPLAAITNAAYVLRVAEPNGPQAIGARNVVDRQARHMAKLVDDLLDIGRLSVGKAELARRTFNLAEVVTDLVAGWRAAGRFARHRIVTKVEPVWVDADRTRLEQVASNLLDNALKFTPDGGIVRITVRAEGDAAVIRVTDAGEGIAPQDLGRVFDLFAQGDQGLARQRGGMGIGLALVKRLAEMHGGTAGVHSDGPGRGTTVSVRVPSVPRPAQRRERAVVPQDVGAHRVLIIEDNPDTRRMLRAALALSGHDVHEAADGAAGLAAAALAQPDVALIDIGLPDIDGYEVARRLRATQADQRLVLIAVTGYGQAEDRNRSREAGFDAHLIKPIGPESVKQAIAAFRSAA